MSDFERNADIAKSLGVWDYALTRHEGVECGPELRAVAVVFLQHFVLGTRNHTMRSRRQMPGKRGNGRGRYDGVVACRKHQDGLANPAGELARTKLGHRRKGRVEPRHGRRRNAERRVGLQDGRVAGVAARVRGEGIAGKARRLDQIAVATWNKSLPHAGRRMTT